MTDKPGFLKRALEQLIEGRQRSAQRFIDGYLRDHRTSAPKKD